MIAGQGYPPGVPKIHFFWGFWDGVGLWVGWWVCYAVRMTDTEGVPSGDMSVRFIEMPESMRLKGITYEYLREIIKASHEKKLAAVFNTPGKDAAAFIQRVREALKGSEWGYRSAIRVDGEEIIAKNAGDHDHVDIIIMGVKRDKS